jgi:hypothetical protein
VTIAGAERWGPLSDAEMAALRGGNPQRGTVTASCNAYQAIIGNPGTWSCVGKADNTDCDLCETQGNITYADMFGNPKNKKDGAAQNCGRQSAPFTASCQGQVCVGSGMWSAVLRCTDPKASVAQP